MHVLEPVLPDEGDSGLAPVRRRGPRRDRRGVLPTIRRVGQGRRATADTRGSSRRPALCRLGDPPVAWPDVTSVEQPALTPGAIILVVESDAESLARVGRELGRRYGGDYRIVSTASADDARANLEAWREEHTPVALVLTAQWMDGLTGTELLEIVSELYPQSKRGLLIDFGDWGDGAPRRRSATPWPSGTSTTTCCSPLPGHDELFHRTITEFLHEWSRAAQGEPRQIVLLARQSDRRGHELRSLLTRNGVPHLSFDSDDRRGHRDPGVARPRPTSSVRSVVFLHDGRVLVDPTNAEVARGYGVTTELDRPAHFDVVIVGAGPAGPGGRGVLPRPRDSTARHRGRVNRRAGGVQLADPQLPRLLARRQRRRARAARVPAGVGVRRRSSCSCTTSPSCGRPPTGHVVTHRRRHRDRGPGSRARDGRHLPASRRPAIEDLLGAGVFYGSSTSEAQTCAGQQVYVVGGGNSAGQAALYLARFASGCTIPVRARRSPLDVEYLRDEIDAAPHVSIVFDTSVVDGGGARTARVAAPARPHRRHRARGRRRRAVRDDRREPRTEWLPEEIERDDHGFIRTGVELDTVAEGRWPFERPPCPFETSVARRLRGRRCPRRLDQAGRDVRRRGQQRDRPGAASPRRTGDEGHALGARCALQLRSRGVRGSAWGAIRAVLRSRELRRTRRAGSRASTSPSRASGSRCSCTRSSGGAGEAGLVAIVQLVPTALAAPFLGTFA